MARLAALRLPHHRTDDIAVVEAEHRDHAVVEQVIAHLKDQAPAHFPSGHFNANAAWTVLAAPANNLLRWSQLLGLPAATVRAARTLRRRTPTPKRPTEPTPPRSRPQPRRATPSRRPRGSIPTSHPSRSVDPG